MQGNDKIIDVLNQLLAEELTAINQYVVHSEMCNNWGYQRLHEVIEKTAIDEMKHAEKIISRILFLEGRPRVDKLNAIHIGSDVKGIIGNDLHAEQDAVRAYNTAIQACHENGDAGTREILEGILKDEEKPRLARGTARPNCTDGHRELSVRTSEMSPTSPLRDSVVWCPQLQRNLSALRLSR